ncbi:hypothetical protein AgCh_017443 [Apium graveolens]
MSKESYGVCWCFRRKFKLGTAEPPEEIKELFKVYSESGLMSADNLKRFMMEIQEEDDKMTRDEQVADGNQLNINCSDVPIIDALRRGVRVIELDMWPNSTKDNVHILHGGYTPVA